MPSAREERDDIILREKLTEVATLLTEFRLRFSEDEKALRELEKLVAGLTSDIKSVDRMRDEQKADLSNLWEVFRACQQKHADEALEDTRDTIKVGRETRWTVLNVALTITGILVALFGIILPLAIWFIKALLTLMQVGAAK